MQGVEGDNAQYTVCTGLRNMVLFPQMLPDLPQIQSIFCLFQIFAIRYLIFCNSIYEAASVSFCSPVEISATVRLVGRWLASRVQVAIAFLNWWLPHQLIVPVLLHEWMLHFLRMIIHTIGVKQRGKNYPEVSCSSTE